MHQPQKNDITRKWKHSGTPENGRKNKEAEMNDGRYSGPHG